MLKASGMSLKSSKTDISSKCFHSLEDKVVKHNSSFNIETTTPTLPVAAHLKLPHIKSSGVEPNTTMNPGYAPGNPFATLTRSTLSDDIRSIYSQNLSLSTSQAYTTPPRKRSLNEKIPPLYSVQTLKMTVCEKSTEALDTLDQAANHPERRFPRWLQAMRDTIFNHIDPKTFLEMVDFRELVYPFGIWKYTVLVLVAIAIAGIAVSEHYLRWIETSMAITRRTMLPVLIVVIGLEPIMISIVLLVAKVPDPKVGSTGLPFGLSDLEAQIQSLEKAPNHSTALVIPCHNSNRTAMKKVLESAYPHFRPQDIFIVDNGRTKYPPDNFRQFIREQNPDIVYIWLPIGSKNAAQLVGSLAAKKYDYIMTMDDDVSIPANFRPPIDKIDHLIKGVAFPLRAMDAKGDTPLFMVAWQDCEYKMSGISKLAESAICGVLYPHGAGWFCERETLVDLISNYHSLDFIAEDVNTGLSMQKMKRRIAFDATMVLETEVPTTIFGPGLNWWQQRKNSWEMGRHGQLLKFAGRLLLSLNGQTTISGILAQKTIHLYAIASIAVDWLRVPVLVTMGSNAIFWRQALLISLASILPLMAFKYIKARRRPDLQPRFWACLTYPIYKQLYAAVSIMGAIRSVIWYIGGHQRSLCVRQMMKANDERVIWLDPRFESNPAFLADEGEALRADGRLWRQES